MTLGKRIKIEATFDNVKKQRFDDYTFPDGMTGAGAGQVVGTPGVNDSGLLLRDFRDIRDTTLPQPSSYSDYDTFDTWPDGDCVNIYLAADCTPRRSTDESASPNEPPSAAAPASVPAARHWSGWAMRNTNNHNPMVLKKSCLGLMICSSPSCRGDIRIRPPICDKARRKQIGKRCPTASCSGKLMLRRCRGNRGFPVTHFWRRIGATIYFQAKGTHGHPKPVLSFNATDNCLEPANGEAKKNPLKLKSVSSLPSDSTSSAYRGPLNVEDNDPAFNVTRQAHPADDGTTQMRLQENSDDVMMTSCGSSSSATSVFDNIDLDSPMLVWNTNGAQYCHDDAVTSSTPQSDAIMQVTSYPSPPPPISVPFGSRFPGVFDATESNSSSTLHSESYGMRSYFLCTSDALTTATRCYSFFDAGFTSVERSGSLSMFDTSTTATPVWSYEDDIDDGLAIMAKMAGVDVDVRSPRTTSGKADRVGLGRTGLMETERFLHALASSS